MAVTLCVDVPVQSYLDWPRAGTVYEFLGVDWKVADIDHNKADIYQPHDLMVLFEPASQWTVPELK